MKYSPASYHKHMKPVATPSEVQSEWAFWFLTKTQTSPRSFVADLAWLWF